MSIRGSTSKVIGSISHNYTKKPLKRGNNEIITQYLSDVAGVTRVACVHG
jgi:hypothetical protein